MLNRIDERLTYLKMMKSNTELFEKQLIHLKEIFEKTAFDDISDDVKEYGRMLFEEMDKFYRLNEHYRGELC